MKKLKKLLPIFSATSIVTILAPTLTSCGAKYSYEWWVGDKFVYGYEQKEMPDGDADKILDEYFKAMKNDPNIFIQDWMTFQLMDKRMIFPAYVEAVGDTGAYHHYVKLLNIDEKEHRMSFEFYDDVCNHGKFTSGSIVHETQYVLDIESSETGDFPIIHVQMDTEILARDKKWWFEIWNKDDWDTGYHWHLDWQEYAYSTESTPPTFNYTTWMPIYFMKGFNLYEYI